MLIFLVAVFMAAGLIPSGCQAFVCPNSEGFYANDADCGNTYWVCTTGRLFFMHCPTDLRYDESQAKCLYPHQVPICPNGDSWKPFQPTTTPDSVTMTEDTPTENTTDPDVTQVTPDYEDKVTSETMSDTSTEQLPASESTTEEEEETTTVGRVTDGQEEEITVSIPSNEGDEPGCFQDLGCFAPDEFPGISMFPMDPSEIKVTFKMFEDAEKRDEVSFGYNIPKEKIAALPLDHQKRTKFLIHGWRDDMTWMQTFRENIIKKYDKYRDYLLEADKQELSESSVNVILVDWSIGAQNVTFETAVVNTKLVAAEMVYLIKNLIKWRGFKPQDIHLIGQNIGAHVAGFVGERFGGDEKIGQITGLDPISRKVDKTGLIFLSSVQYFSATNGLDSTDARLVTNIHTTVHGYGPIEWTGEGHYDFYPNGGYMSGRLYRCVPPAVVGRSWDCDYIRAAGLAQYDYSSSVKRYEVCQPVGYRCENYETFLAGNCSDCGKNQTDCQLMPNYFDHWDRKQESIVRGNKFFFEAGGIRSFCLYHYQVVVHMTNGWPSDHKNITLDFVVDDDYNNITMTIDHLSDADLETKRVVTSDIPMYPLQFVNVAWKGWVNESKNPILSIDVNYMSNIDPGIRKMFSVKLCPRSNSVFKPCNSKTDGNELIGANIN